MNDMSANHIRIDIPEGFSAEIRNGKLSLVPTSTTEQKTRPTYDQCLYPVPDYLSNLTDGQITEAVELEFSATGEWPESDPDTFRAILKHAPTVLRLTHNEDEDEPKEIKTAVPASSIGDDSRFLTWLSNRLVNVYGEDPRIDFVLATRRIATSLQKPLPAAAPQYHCNKCGYLGPDETHSLPYEIGKCFYLAGLITPSNPLPDSNDDNHQR